MKHGFNFNGGHGIEWDEIHICSSAEREGSLMGDKLVWVKYYDVLVWIHKSVIFGIQVSFNYTAINHPKLLIQCAARSYRSLMKLGGVSCATLKI